MRRELVGIAQPAMRRELARTPPGRELGSRSRHAAGRYCNAAANSDDDLGLAQCVEDLAVEKLVAQPPVEALDEAVLPRAARGDLSWHCSPPCEQSIAQGGPLRRGWINRLSKKGLC